LTLPEVVALMGGYSARWWISGGVALELYLGRAWRRHEDMDVAIYRRDVPHLAGVLVGWEVVGASRGEMTQWDGGPLPAAMGQNSTRRLSPCSICISLGTIRGRR